MSLTFDQGLILLLLGIVVGGSLEKKRRNLINQIRKQLDETKKIETDEEADEEADEESGEESGEGENTRTKKGRGPRVPKSKRPGGEG